MLAPVDGEPAGETRDGSRVYRVSELLEQVRDRLESGYAQVVVEGEVGECTVARSGHVYFTLSDESGDASLRAVMWRGRYSRRPFDLETGRKVQCTGRLTLYPPRGAFQMDVQGFVDAGEGALARQFREVVGRLEKEGLTDPARRRPLPPLPGSIGIVTSPDGAALRDILRVLGRRFPVPVLLSPSPVQGEGAAVRLRAALERLDRAGRVDVIIIGRGGGSAEDLEAFNDEALARAVAATATPVISAVGHEVDVSVTDLVADRRAATPSEAAELAMPSREEVEERVRDLARRIGAALRSRIERRRSVILRLDNRLPRPDRMIQDRRQKLDEIVTRIGRAGPEGRIVEGRRAVERHLERADRLMQARLGAARSRFAARAASLQALSPLAVLGRGYSVVQRVDGTVVRDEDQVERGEDVAVRLLSGGLACRVTDKTGKK
jgi:exodeoxyribonuclease VII large subunit